MRSRARVSTHERAPGSADAGARRSDRSASMSPIRSTIPPTIGDYTSAWAPIYEVAQARLARGALVRAIRDDRRCGRVLVAHGRTRHAMARGTVARLGTAALDRTRAGLAAQRPRARKRALALRARRA